MGIYDRDYYRDEPGGVRLGGDLSMVTQLILANVAIYLVTIFTARGQDFWLAELMALSTDAVREPWKLYQLLTCGFAHDPHHVWHIAYNMLALWFFGRDVEAIYGRREFLQTYLSLVVLSSGVWLAMQYATGERASMVGASGAISGVILVFIFHFPHRTILFSLIIPMPVWVFGIIFIGQDVLGAIDRTGNVAYTAHLGGALFGFIYFKTRWQLGRLWPSQWRLPKFSLRPKLKVHDPDPRERDLAAQADEILAKISRHGQESLTSEEQRILQDYSRRMQQKRR